MTFGDQVPCEFANGPHILGNVPKATYLAISTGNRQGHINGF